MRKNKKTLIGIAALTLFDIAAASAASPAPVMPNWAGFYVGAHAGYRWADGTFASPGYTLGFSGLTTGPASFPGRNEKYGLSSGIFGLHAGYNYLLSSSWLVGIEGDVSQGQRSSSQSGAFQFLDAPPDNDNDGFTFRRTSTLKLTWQATIRARFGYISGPWLFYGTGGVAFIHANWSDSSTMNVLNNGNTVSTPTATWSGSETLTGGVVGAGVEYMFNRNWIGRVEYLYERFGGFNAPHGFGPQIGRVEIGDVQKLRVGISYKFGN